MRREEQRHVRRAEGRLALREDRADLLEEAFRVGLQQRRLGRPEEARHGGARQVERSISIAVDTRPCRGLRIGVGSGGAGADDGALTAVGGVAARLRADPLVAVRHPEGHRLHGEVPPHRLVDEGILAIPAVGQVADGCHVGRCGGSGDRGAKPGDAGVTVGTARHGRQADAHESCRFALADALGHVPAQGGPGALEHRLEELRVLLGGQSVADDAQVLGGRHDGVTHHLPERHPEQLAQQRILDAGDASAGEVEGDRVELDLGVGVIVVVGEDEQRSGTSRCPRDQGTRPGDAGSDRLEPPPFGPVGEDRHLEGVRAQRRVSVRRRLFQGQRIDATVGGLPAGRDGIDRRGLEPEPCPVAQVASRTRLERGEEVRQRGVAPGVAREIGPHAGGEGVTADGGRELLQHRSTLPVRDAVEVQEGAVGIRGVAGDGMRGGQLILSVGPTLQLGGERAPGSPEARRGGQAEEGGV